MASLRALECLVTVADVGSITEAARLLHTSQPAVSHQLAGLEREVQAKLLVRGSRGVLLTPAGRAAVVEARRALQAVDAALLAARATGRAGGGTLRIGCPQSLTVGLLAPVLRQWHRQRPQVAITVREGVTFDGILDLVDSDQADVVILPGPVPERYTSTPVASEEVVLSASTTHPLAERDSVLLADLDGLALVHFTPDNGLGAWLDRACAAAGVAPHAVMRTATTATAPQLAAAGLGAAVTPVSAIGAGFPGIVRSFAPRWFRPLVAVGPGPPDPLAARFIADLKVRGVRVSADVRAQLGPDLVSDDGSDALEVGGRAGSGDHSTS